MTVPGSADGTPDYGWTEAAGEASHAYLDSAVLGEIARLCAPARPSTTPPRIFDAGCGNGALLTRLAPLARDLAGCDSSASGVNIARTALPGIRIEQLSVYDDLAGCFGTDWDIVVSTEVIEHLYSPRVFVTQVRRLLRPGGTLIVTTPYHGYLKNLAVAAAGGFDRHVTALWDGGHIKFWSFATLRTLLAEQGFRGFHFRGAGRWPLLWKSMVVSCQRDPAER